VYAPVLLRGAVVKPTRDRIGPTGRYQVSTRASIAMIVDTATGEAWTSPSIGFMKPSRSDQAPGSPPEFCLYAPTPERILSSALSMNRLLGVVLLFAGLVSGAWTSFIIVDGPAPLSKQLAPSIITTEPLERIEWPRSECLV
jgi:hypothetical protein